MLICGFIKGRGPRIPDAQSAVDKLGMKPRVYALPDGDHRLIISPEVLQTFTKYRQLEKDPEAGGLLFGVFRLPEKIIIVEASVPSSADKRWRTLFIPNRVKQRILVASKFRDGLHFVGEWHTHPEPTPEPSNLDLTSSIELFRRSKHELRFFVSVIVGNKTDVLSMWVSIHDGSRHFRLCETSGTSEELA
jgi:integrative and conjugative element protein (TIGR02256 family)